MSQGFVDSTQPVRTMEAKTPRAEPPAHGQPSTVPPDNGERHESCASPLAGRSGQAAAREIAAKSDEAMGPLPERIYGRDSIKQKRKTKGHVVKIIKTMRKRMLSRMEKRMVTVLRRLARKNAGQQFLSQQQVDLLLYPTRKDRMQADKEWRQRRRARTCKPGKRHWLCNYVMSCVHDEFPSEEVLLGGRLFLRGEFRTVYVSIACTKREEMNWFDTPLPDGRKPYEVLSQGMAAAREIASMVDEAMGPLPVRIYGRDSIKQKRKGSW